jgi:hypothetical protein
MITIARRNACRVRAFLSLTNGFPAGTFLKIIHRKGKLFMKIFSLLALLLISVSAHAAVTGTCENFDSIGNLIGNTKTFAKGAVKVAYISTEEPATSPDHLLIFVYGDEMSINCTSINAGPEAHGFGSIAMDKLKATNDDTKGLLLTFPANVWTGEDGKYKTEMVKVRVNRSGRVPAITIEN